MPTPASHEPALGPPPPAGFGLPFVGRDRELRALRGRLDAALAGAGSAVMLVGEPGIGKTRTAQQFAGAARERGVRVLWGRCFDGEWAPPYGPWVDALGRYAQTCDPEQLRRELGAGASPIAQFVPGVRAALPDVPSPVALGGEEERVRVEDAVAQFLLAGARRQPVLLVLDDLHWADRASLGLLRYLGRFLPEARLLLVGTYRDAEVGPRHPLASALGELRREADYRGVPLVGLGPAETGALLAEAASAEVADDLVRAIHAQTNGNPFFAGEVLRHLLEEGRLEPRHGRLIASGDPADLGIPDGVRQVVGRRLARLADETTRMLGYAAIFTGGFDFRVLQALTDLPEDELLDALDEALATGLIRAVDGKRETYDFVHAIVRNTLDAEWSPSRKVRLHRRLAEALERVHAGRELEHAAELAVQYHESAALPGAARGILYARAAADRARANAGRDEAVAFLRMARDLAADGDHGSRGAILCQLALAEAEALLLDDARRTVEAALNLLEAGDATPDAVAAFLATVAAALEDGGAPNAVWQPLVERGLALVGDRRDLTWARLCLTLKPFAPTSSGAINASRWLGSDPAAVALARASGQEDDFARTFQPFDPRTPEDTRAMLARARAWQRPAAIIRALVTAGADWLYYHGDLREAAIAFEELLATAARFGSVSAQAEALIRLTIVQIALGEHDRARGTEIDAHAMVARLGPGHHLQASAAWTTALLAEHLEGDWAAIAAFWTRFVADPGAGENAIVLDDAALAAYAHARAGNAPEARRLLAALTPVLARMDPTDWLVNGAIAFGAGAVWNLGARELAAPYLDLGCALVAAGRGDYPCTSNELTVARMATLLGDRPLAEDYFARARRSLAAGEQRPLRVVVDHDEAHALLRLGDSRLDRVPVLLDAALTGFRGLGLTGWARRTVALQAEAARRAEHARPVHPAGLTEREVAVLRLVAQGGSDRDISDRLYLSPRTVNAHLRNMLRKTELTNRTELSVWAVEHGLVARD